MNNSLRLRNGIPCIGAFSRLFACSRRGESFLSFPCQTSDLALFRSTGRILRDLFSKDCNPRAKTGLDAVNSDLFAALLF